MPSRSNSFRRWMCCLRRPRPALLCEQGMRRRELVRWRQVQAVRRYWPVLLCRRRMQHRKLLRWRDVPMWRCRAGVLLSWQYVCNWNDLRIRQEVPYMRGLTRGMLREQHMQRFHLRSKLSATVYMWPIWSGMLPRLRLLWGGIAAKAIMFAAKKGCRRLNAWPQGAPVALLRALTAARGRFAALAFVRRALTIINRVCLK